MSFILVAQTCYADVIDILDSFNVRPPEKSNFGGLYVVLSGILRNIHENGVLIRAY